MNIINELNFLYCNKLFEFSDKIVIVLPDNTSNLEYFSSVVDKFAHDFQVLAFGVDFYYTLTGEKSEFQYPRDEEKYRNLMQKMTAEIFLNFFDSTINTISRSYPQVREIIVCGFCFGGRLSALSGLNLKVNKVISFYGGGLNNQFYKGQSAIEALAKNRSFDSNFQILNIYGESDTLISRADSDLIKEVLENSGINHFEAFYNAGHAFFQNHRQSYSKIEADKAWERVKLFLN